MDGTCGIATAASSSAPGIRRLRARLNDMRPTRPRARSRTAFGGYSCAAGISRRLCCLVWRRATSCFSRELRAAVKEAHKRGLKITGHLCSVTYQEAAEIGIDNLEHGFFVNTELDPDKKPDTCSASGGDYTLEHTMPGSAEADRLIAMLVRHHVAITSTLPGLASTLPGVEASVDGRPLVRPAGLQALAPTFREEYSYNPNRPSTQS